MYLKMFVQAQLIDSILIDDAQFNQPGYIAALRMNMEEKNEDILDLSDEEATFFIDSVPSSMNSSNERLSN